MQSYSTGTTITMGEFLSNIYNENLGSSLQSIAKLGVDWLPEGKGEGY
jgi:hypothetical protein